MPKKFRGFRLSVKADGNLEKLRAFTGLQYTQIVESCLELGVRAVDDAEKAEREEKRLDDKAENSISSVETLISTANNADYVDFIQEEKVLERRLEEEWTQSARAIALYEQMLEEGKTE